MARIFQAVDTNPIAQQLTRRTLTNTGAAKGPARAANAATPAVLVVGLCVGADAGTRGQPRRTGAHTLARHAGRGRRRTRRRTGAAVRGARREIDAHATAGTGSRGTAANSGHTDSASGANATAVATVVGVGARGHAGTFTGEQRGAAADGADAVRTNLPSRARRPAAATILGIGQDVDAAFAARPLLGAADTLPESADLPTGARLATQPAVGRIGIAIYTGARTKSEARAAGTGVHQILTSIGTVAGCTRGIAGSVRDPAVADGRVR